MQKRLSSNLKSRLHYSAAVVILRKGKHSVGLGSVATDAVQHPPLFCGTSLFQHLLDHIVAEGILHQDENVLLHLVDDTCHLQVCMTFS